MVDYDGFENYKRAADAGARRTVADRTRRRVGALRVRARGVWPPAELSGPPARQSIPGPLDQRYRELSGNRTIDKNKAVRARARNAQAGGEVGLLMDVNTFWRIRAYSVISSGSPRARPRGWLSSLFARAPRSFRAS